MCNTKIESHCSTDCLTTATNKFKSPNSSSVILFISFFFDFAQLIVFEAKQEKSSIFEFG